MMLVPDTILAATAAIAWGGGPLLFGGVIVGLQLFHLVRWVVARLVDEIVFLLHGRKQMTHQLLEYLRENRYPEPQVYEDSPESYLARVVEDRAVAGRIRLLAAAEVGALSTWRTLREYGVANRFERAYEDALQAYKRSFPPGAALGADDSELDDCDDDRA